MSDSHAPHPTASAADEGICTSADILSMNSCGSIAPRGLPFARARRALCRNRETTVLGAVFGDKEWHWVGWDDWILFQPLATRAANI
jgi:hypothetical protein